MTYFLNPLLANIFVGFQVKLLLDKFPMPYYYVYYVDDTLASSSSHNEAIRFFQYLNNFHPSLKFTMKGKTKWLNFSWMFWSKSTFSRLYLCQDSFAHKTKKINFIKEKLLIVICSECKLESKLNCSIGWNCRIYQLHLYGRVRPSNRVSYIWHLTIWRWCSSNAGALGNAEYPFIAIASRSTMTRSGSTW